MKKFLAGLLVAVLFSTLIVATSFAAYQYEIIELPYAPDVHGCFSEGYATILINGSFSYIDENGKIPSWLKDDYLVTFTFGDGLAAVMNNDNKVGYIDKNGNLVIDFIFDYRTFQGIYSVGKFVNGKTIVHIQEREFDGYYNNGDNSAYIETYYIDKSGNILGRVGENDDISEYICFDIGSCSNEESKTININGKEFEYVHFDNGIAIVEDYDEDKMYIVKEKFEADVPQIEVPQQKPANPEPSSWAKAEIEKAESYGITANLYSNYNVEGNYYKDYITREEFASLIVGCIEPLQIGMFAPIGDESYTEVVEENNNNVEFTDTENEDVYIAYEMGVVNGVGDGKFAPKKNITRQEIAVMMHRAIKYAEKETGKKFIEDNSVLNGYTDYDSIASWAKDSVGILANNSVMKGTSESTISPLNNASREQAIMLAVRIYELLK